MYLIDANAFIEPSNSWYRMGFCPAYWQWLEQAAQAGVLKSLKAVKAEIKKMETPEQQALYAWCNGRGQPLFKDSTYHSSHLDQVASWVRSDQNKYSQHAEDEFLQVDKADSLLVAEALAIQDQGVGCIVVSREEPRPKKVGKVKLPDVCAALEIGCIQPWEMLSQERASFVLAAG